MHILRHTKKPIQAVWRVSEFLIRGLAKMYISYGLYAFCDAAHEVVHSFQSFAGTVRFVYLIWLGLTFAGQKDSSPNWWRLEHDASVVAMNILQRVSLVSLDSV